MAVDISAIAKILDEKLKATNLSKVTADGAGYEDLPLGYFLVEVQAAELKLNKNGDPMVSFKTQVLNNGFCYDEAADKYLPIQNTKGRIIFKNWNLVNEQDIKRFVSDMLKFEDENGNPYFADSENNEISYFSNTEFLNEAINIVAESKLRIYVLNSTYKSKNGEDRTSLNFVKWDAIDQIIEDYGLDNL